MDFTAPSPGSRAAVIGLGKSGFQSALFLHKKGFHVFASEKGSSPEIQEQAARLREAGIETETGTHTQSRILECDWALISPGIKPSHDVSLWLRDAAKPVYSEIEAASWFCPSKNIIAVTGSCGKTTLATLLARLLERAGRKTLLCGNIGNPWIGEIERITPDTFIVLELSSFQLAGCRSFHPRLAFLTNIFPNHLDWHPDMEDYTRCKLKMFERQQGEDTAVVREEEAHLLCGLPGFAGKVCVLKSGSGRNPHQEMLEEACRTLDIPEPLGGEVFRSFEGLEHRMEKAGEAGGVFFVNDSKSTTTASLKWALEKFSDGEVLLIAGGMAKSRDFGDIAGLVQRKCRGVYLIGRDRAILAEFWQASGPQQIETLEEALREAFRQANSGNTVLLSPACASFDQFANYMARGDAFKEMVRNLKSANKQLR